VDSQHKSLQALISLLDDPDHSVFEHVRSEIEKLGHNAIPALEHAWESHEFGELFEERVENLIQMIQSSSVVNGLSLWVHSEEQNLLEGLLTLTKFRYPNLKLDFVHEFFEKARKDIWLELNDELTALEKLKVINHILFDVYGFAANKDDYHHPDNSFIHRVIETRKGNPISLSCLYLILARQLELPIYGVNLPRHFILAWVDQVSIDEGKTPKDADILFYFNPFSEGAVFGANDIDAFLQELQIKPNPIFFRPCTSIDILKRTLNNLGYAYQQLGLKEKAEEIFALKKSLEG
jgi:regulator of sirC expression with transglutaminase-like and TPR domain